MPAKKKSWTDKMNHPAMPEVKPIDVAYGGSPAGSRMLIPTPRLIEAYLRQIPAGQTIAPEVMRRDLAADQAADFSCPLTSGIFLRIAAEAALEEMASGRSEREVTPFWRVVDPGSPLAGKLSCGRAFVEAQRKKEQWV
ncbi:MAG: hypothetical protein ACO3GN_05460 [Bacteroidia bacterium]|jgi:hypothetical protein